MPVSQYERKTKLQTVVEAFKKRLSELDQSVETYVAGTASALNSYLKWVWKEEIRDSATKNVNEVIVYWTSIFREKGILRASTKGGTGQTAETSRMQKLMVLDRDNPRHLLVWLLATGKTSAEIVIVDTDGEVESVISDEEANGSGAHVIITTNRIRRPQGRKLDKELERLLVPGKWRSPLSDPDLPSVIRSTAGISLTDKTFKTLLHPLYRASESDYLRIVYIPLELDKTMFAGVVLGLKDSTPTVEISVAKLKREVCGRFLYTVHSAEARAAAITSSPSSNLWFPKQAFGDEDGKCAWGNVKNKLSFQGVIEAVQCNVTNRVVNKFLQILQKALCGNGDLLSRDIPFWNYAEEIYWALFDSVDEKLRNFKTAADVLRSREKIVKREHQSSYGPMGLICRALANELPLQELANYRDHFVHSFHVFLVGLAILQSDCPTFQIRPSAKSDTELAWLLTAFFHDIAYGIERLESLANDYLQEIAGEGMAKVVSRDAEASDDGDFKLRIPMHPHWGFALTPVRFIRASDGVVESFRRLSANPKLYLRSLLHRVLMGKSADHGVLSAILLQHSFCGRNPNNWLATGNNKRILARAVSAIALHNGPMWLDKNSELSKSDKWSEERKSVLIAAIRKDPLRSLLIFSDEIACMGRQPSEKYITVKIKKLLIFKKSIRAVYHTQPWKDVKKRDRRQDNIKEATGIKISLSTRVYD